MTDKTAIRDKLVSLLATGDLASAVQYLEPDFEIVAARPHPYAGTRRGAAGLAELVKGMLATYAFEIVKPLETFAGENPDEVVFRFALKGKVIATGEAFETTALELWRFHNDRVSAIVPHWFEIPASR